jgi:hypothetical protein
MQGSKMLSLVIILNLLSCSMHASSQRITGLSPFPCPPTSNTPESHPIINSEVEPSIDVADIPHFDTVVAAAWQQDRYTAGGGCSANYMRLSFDKGKHWGKMIPLPNVLCFNGPYERASDPQVRISNNGSVYFTGLGFNFSDAANAVTVGRYDLKKKKFKLTELDVISSPTAQVTTDYPTLTIEKLDRSGDTLYMTWDLYFFSNVDPNFEYGVLRFVKSTDGKNWSEPKSIYGLYPDFQAYSPDVEVSGARIELLDNPRTKKYSRLINISGIQTGLVDPDVPMNNFYVALRSDDQGETWSDASIINPDGLTGVAVDPDDTSAVLRSGDGVPSTATDRERNLIYAAIQEYSLIAATNPAPSRIDLYVSKDGGKNWVLAGPVNTDLTVQAFNQAIQVVEDGKIAVTYYDFRNHTPNPDTTLPLETDRWQDVYSYCPKTNTLKLKSEKRLTPISFNMRLAPNLAGSPISPPGYFLGDYQEMKYFDDKLYQVYGVTVSTMNPSDIVFQRTSP